MCLDRLCLRFSYLGRTVFLYGIQEVGSSILPSSTPNLGTCQRQRATPDATICCMATDSYERGIILKALAVSRRDHDINSLASETGLDESVVFWHLGRLRSKGLVERIVPTPVPLWRIAHTG